MDTIETKKCTGECGLKKTLDCFRKGRNQCRVCISKYEKEYREKNPQKRKNANKKWREENSNYNQERQKNGENKIQIIIKKMSLKNQEITSEKKKD